MNVIIVIIDLHFFFVQGNCICKIERKGMIPTKIRKIDGIARTNNSEYFILIYEFYQIPNISPKHTG